MFPKQRIGKLLFRDAVSLKSETYRFGGFSTLNILGDKMYALSDEGRLLRATLRLKGNKIEDISNAAFDPLWPEGKEPDKADYDSEAMLHLGNNRFAIGFEQHHRIGLYQLGKKIENIKIFPAPEEMTHLNEPNQGIEALAELAPNRLLALTETPRDDTENPMGYIVDLKTGAWQKLYLKKTDAFRPTELAAFDDKHLLLLERSYGVLNGMEARISLIKRSDIRPDAVLETTELARFDDHTDIDNMEGIATLKNKDGSTDILLISDDNFNPVQQTILVLLNLPKKF